MAPPEFFDFPAVEITLSDVDEVKKLMERVLVIQFFSDRAGVLRGVPRKTPKRKGKKKRTP